MPPITKSNDEIIKEAVEEALKKNNELLFEKLNTAQPGSRISQILRNAKGQPPAPPSENKQESEEKEREEKKKKEEKEKEEKDREEKKKQEEVEQREREDKKKQEELEKKEKEEKEKQEKLKSEEIEKEKAKLEEIKKKEREDFDKEKERLQKELQDTEFFCPTCSGKKEAEHKHKLKKTEKGTLKCSGEGCNTEYALIPTVAEYKCDSCGTPHARPKHKEDEATDTCPFCGGNSFIKPDVDYKKIREKITKKLQKLAEKTKNK